MVQTTPSIYLNRSTKKNRLIIIIFGYFYCSSSISTQYNVSSTQCILIGLCMTNSFLKDDHTQTWSEFNGVQFCGRKNWTTGSY